MLRKFHSRAFILLLLTSSFLSAARSQTVPARPTPTQSSPQLSPSPGSPQRNPVFSRPQQTPEGAQNHTAPAVAETVVPELYWHTQREAEAMLVEAHLQFKPSSQAEGPIVVSQEPTPGSRVQSGSTVTITLGQPQLLLSANQLQAAINTNINFTASLEPALPQTTAPVGAVAAYIPPRLYAAYTFYWDDSSQTGPVTQATLPHHYGVPKTYNVFATAQVGNYPMIKSNPVSITVPEPIPVTPSYAVNLRVEPRVVDAGKEVKATIDATPPPGPDAAYKFDWGDGAQEVHSAPTATHTYSPPARRRPVHATVTVAGRDFHSNAIAVEVRTPPPPPESGQSQESQQTTSNPWPLIIGTVLGIGLLFGIYKLVQWWRRPPLRLPQGLSIVGSRGQVQQEIRHAEQIGKTPGIRFISGCTSAVSMTPQSGITKKRSTSHA